MKRVLGDLNPSIKWDHILSSIVIIFNTSTYHIHNYGKLFLIALLLMYNRTSYQPSVLIPLVLNL